MTVIRILTAATMLAACSNAPDDAADVGRPAPVEATVRPAPCPPPPSASDTALVNDCVEYTRPALGAPCKLTLAPDADVCVTVCDGETGRCGVDEAGAPACLFDGVPVTTLADAAQRQTERHRIDDPCQRSRCEPSSLTWEPLSACPDEATATPTATGCLCLSPNPLTWDNIGIEGALYTEVKTISVAPTAGFGAGVRNPRTSGGHGNGKLVFVAYGGTQTTVSDGFFTDPECSVRDAVVTRLSGSKRVLASVAYVVDCPDKDRLRVGVVEFDATAVAVTPVSPALDVHVKWLDGGAADYTHITNLKAAAGSGGHIALLWQTHDDVPTPVALATCQWEPTSSTTVKMLCGTQLQEQFDAHDADIVAAGPGSFHLLLERDAGRVVRGVQWDPLIQNFLSLPEAPLDGLSADELAATYDEGDGSVVLAARRDGTLRLGRYHLSEAGQVTSFSVEVDKAPGFAFRTLRVQLLGNQVFVSYLDTSPTGAIHVHTVVTDPLFAAISAPLDLSPTAGHVTATDVRIHPTLDDWVASVAGILTDAVPNDGQSVSAEADTGVIFVWTH